MIKSIDMEYVFLRIGNNEPCHLKPIKKSMYCSMHNLLLKTVQVNTWLRCGKGTCSNLQFCNICGRNNIRQQQRHHK